VKETNGIKNGYFSSSKGMKQVNKRIRKIKKNYILFSRARSLINFRTEFV